MFGFGKKKKEKELEERALAGDAEAQYGLALDLQTKDFDRSMEFYWLAARQGHEQAIDWCCCWCLSDLLLSLIDDYTDAGISAKVEKVFEAMQLDAQFCEGEHAQEYAFLQRLKAVLDTNLAAAVAGDAAALYNLAKFYYDDPDTVEVFNKAFLEDQHYDAPVAWLETAVESGYAPAVELLAKME